MSTSKGFRFRKAAGTPSSVTSADERSKAVASARQSLRNGSGGLRFAVPPPKYRLETGRPARPRSAKLPFEFADDAVDHDGRPPASNISCGKVQKAQPGTAGLQNGCGRTPTSSPWDGS